MQKLDILIAVVGVVLLGCSANPGASNDTTSGGTGPISPPFGSGGAGGGGMVSGGTSALGAGGAPGGASGTLQTSGGFTGIAGAMTASGGFGGIGGAMTMSGGSAGTMTTSGGSAGIGGSSGSSGMAGAGGGGGAGGIVSSAGPLHFGPNVRINDDTGSTPQHEVTLATSNGVLAAGWNDGRNAVDRNGYKCGFSISRDGGMTWGANFFAATKGTNSFDGDPGVAADDAGNFYLSCEDYGVKQIVFASSTDTGMTFTPFSGAQSAIDKPWISAARDGTVFMSWLGQPGGFKRSLDHGKTWDPVISLGPLSRGTAIASGSNGYVHIPFATDGGKLHYVRSQDWGQTAASGRDLDSIGTQSCTSCEPRDLPVVGCAADPSGNTVAITWAGILSGGDGDDDVWVLISKDGGDTWSKRLRANDNKTASRQFQPWVAVDTTGRVHVAWTDLRNGGTNAVYYASALDPTQGFGPNVEVTDKRGPANTFLGDYKGVIVQGPYLFVAWTDTRSGNPDIYVSRAKLDGSTP